MNNAIFGDLSGLNFKIGGSTTLNTSAVLDLSSQTNSMLLPVGTTGQEPTCVTALKGGFRYNSTLDNPEFCDGSNWRILAAGSTSCSAPSGLTFTNVTDQALGTVITSNTATITFTGCSTAVSVSVSGAATAQISINGGSWVTSGAITSGQTLQVRLTSSGSVSTTLTATVTVNATSTNWTVTTRSGSLKSFTTSNTYIASALGGLSGADGICQSEAGTLGYAGTYKAVMSDESTNAKDRLTLSYPIVRATDSATVSAVNLWNGTLSNTFGGTTSTVLSGTNTDGTKHAGRTCTSWTSSSGTADCGDASKTTTTASSGWISACNYGLSVSCGVQAKLDCIQQ